MTLHDRLKPVPDEDLPSGRGWNAVVLGVALAVLAAGFALAMPYAARPVTREVVPATRLRPSPDTSQPLILPSPTSSDRADAELDLDEAKHSNRGGRSHQQRRDDARSTTHVRRREPARSNDGDDGDDEDAGPDDRAGDDDDDEPRGAPDHSDDDGDDGHDDAGSGDDDDDDDDSGAAEDHGGGNGKGHDDEDSEGD